MSPQRRGDPRLEVLSDELELVPSLVDGTDHSVHNGSRHARSDGDPTRQAFQTGQLALLGLTAASDQPLSRRKEPHGPDGSHGVGEELAAVPRPSLSNRAAPPPKSCNTTGYSTNAGARIPCWKRRLREAPSAVNLWFAADLLGCLEGVGAFWLFFPTLGEWGGGGILTLGAVLGGRSSLGRLSGFFGPLTRGSKRDPRTHRGSVTWSPPRLRTLRRIRQGWRMVPQTTPPLRLYIHGH